MMAMVHIYYTVEHVAYGGQGFRDVRTVLATFEYKHEAETFVMNYKKENELLWADVEIREHIER